MKNFISRLSALCSTILVTTVTAQAEPLAPGTYKLTPENTQVEFSIDNFWGVITTHGKFRLLQGELLMAEPFENSKVQVTIDTNSIDTNIGKRDEHLRDSDFLATATYPTMTFQSTKVSGNSEAFEVAGLLRLKAVSKPVILKAQLSKDSTEISATMTLNRQDFGVSYAGKGLADDVQVELTLRPNAAIAK